MKKIIDFIYDKLIASIVAVIGIIMTLTILLQIFSRSFMSTPFSWTEELSRITFMWFCFLGSGIAMKHKAHLGIDYFFNKFSIKTQHSFTIFIHIMVIIFSIYLMIYGTRISLMMHKQLSSVLRVPMSFFYAVLPITGLLYLITTIYFLVLEIKHKEKDTKEHTR